MKTFFTTIRVPYRDTDKMGVVYYGNYFTWFEICRNEYFRKQECLYTDLEKEHIYLPVVDAHCDYKNPARYDDEVMVYLSKLEAKGIRLKFSYLIENKADGAIIASGYTTHVFIDENRKPIKIPARVLALIG